MELDVRGWYRNPLALGQCFLVALVAAGLSDFGAALSAYLAEYAVTLFVSLLFFSPTRRLLLRRLYDFLVQTAFLAILTLFIFATLYGRKDQVVEGPDSLWKPAAYAAVYCLLSFVPVVLKARRTADPAREWVRLMVAPNWALPFVLLVAFFAGNLAYALVGNASVSSHRLASTALMAVTALLRVVFTHIMTPRTDDAINAEYRTFMNPK